MLRNSIGNLAEIFHLLDTDIYNGTEVEEHYKMLVEKWGEWQIVGDVGSKVIIKYVDIRNAIFSGITYLYAFLSLFCFVLSIMLGKVLFPALAKHYASTNDELVDMTTIRLGAANDQKEWF